MHSPSEEEVRELVRAEWTSALGPPRSDTTEFEEAGGHPLLLARVLRRIDRGMGTELHHDFSGPATVQSLVRAALGPGSELDPGVLPLPAATDDDGDTLLTGATGYFGVHLLPALLARRTGLIHCLVRGRDRHHAESRLQETLGTHEVRLGAAASRVRVHRADLARPGLGMDAATRRVLEQQVSTIVHAAARVSFVLPPEQLWAENVEAVAELLGLACRGRAKALHHISTLGLLTESGGPTAYERAAPEPSRDASGYLVTKHAAEHLVTTAHQRGIDVRIHRPWVLMGHSHSGACDPDDYTSRVLLGCMLLGAAPDLDVACNVVPVDHAAAAVAHVTTVGPADREHLMLHYANPRPAVLRQVWRWVAACGYPLDVVPLSAWLERLGQSEQNPLHDLVPLLTPHPGRPLQLPRIDTSRSDEALAGAGLTCPPVDRRLVAGVLGHLARRGRLDRPVAGAVAAS